MSSFITAYIVGDSFEPITHLFNAITASQLERMLSSRNEGRADAERRKYVLGQGVGATRYCSLWKQLAEYGELEEIVLDPPVAPEKASRFHTHKHNDHNILIGQPEQIEPKHYRARLLIDDRCDDMADHVTGFHISGMCVLEAARQMVLAVAEGFIIEEARRGTLRFSTESVSATYDGFILPLPATLILAEQRLRKGPGGDFVLTAAIDFIQNNKRLARVETTVSAISRQFVELRERRLVSSLLGSAQQADLSSLEIDDAGHRHELMERTQ